MPEDFGLAIAPIEPTGLLTESVIQFSRLLNGMGFNLSQSHTLLALEALSIIDLSDKRLFESALRLTFVGRPEERALFAAAFDAYWCFEHNEAPTDAALDSTFDNEDDLQQLNVDPSELPNEELERILASFSYEAFWSEDVPAQEQDQDGAENTPQESNEHKTLDVADQYGELTRLVRALEKQFMTRKSRRLVAGTKSGRPDFRKWMKNSVRFGGVPISPSWLTKKRLRPKMVLFVDVSRSMASHAKLLLRFTSSVLRHSWQVEVFLFATNTIRISDTQMKDEELDVDQIIADCGGGTRIGDNLNYVMEHYDYVFTGHGTTTIILSDGLDSGDSERLLIAMRRLSERSRQVIWLSPLMGLQDYLEPTRDILPALEFVDLIAPAHNMDSLWNLLSLIKTGDGKTSVQLNA